jgi:hypothetical protein
MLDSLAPSTVVSNQLISLTSRERIELEKLTSPSELWLKVSNQLISLTSRELIFRISLSGKPLSFSQVSNQLISLTSRESNAFKKRGKRQYFEFPIN